MKVCFFSARPFGLQGTPGTYLFLQNIVRHVDALVVSPAEQLFQVHAMPKTLPWLPAGEISTAAGIQEILPQVAHFDPDLVYVFNFPEWPLCVRTLKSAFKEKMIVLDIKTPLLADGARRRKIQHAAQQAQDAVDLVMTLSSESVRTWIPELSRPVQEYPLGIDISFFPDSAQFSEKEDLRHFVYIGSLHPKRKIEKLIDCFSQAADQVQLPLQLDLYGRGQNVEPLRKRVEVAGSLARIDFPGLVPQQELWARLQEYYAGIAWVPKEIFSHSPSLKALEYMASGLPVLASKTKAHQSLEQEAAQLFLFENEPSSFAKTLESVQRNGLSREVLIENRKAVEQYDYNHIILSFFLPAFYKLLKRAHQSEQCEEKIETLATCASPDETVQDVKTKKQLLKIFLVCPSLAEGKGGAERVAMETAQAMAGRGHLVYMAYADKGPPAYSRENGVVLMPFASLNRLAADLEALDPDVFFVFYFNRNLIDFYSLVHKKKIPFGMQECTNPQRLIDTSWCRGLQQDIPLATRTWEREAIGAAAQRIRLTMPGYIQSFPDYIQPNVRAFPNPAFPQQQPADPAGQTAEQKIILNIGGMKRSKNLIDLLQAFAPLARAYPHWRIKVVGKTAEGNEPHKVAIRECIQSRNLQEQVFIAGPTDDIFAEFAAAQIHAIASLSEGCPTAVLEAMATGVPSVGFADCSGTNELIRDGQNGLLVPAEHRGEGLREALHELMDSPKLRVRLGDQARQDAAAFAPEIIYDQWEQLFYEAAAYKDDPERLSREQSAIDPDRAAQTALFRDKLVQACSERHVTRDPLLPKIRRKVKRKIKKWLGM